MRLDTEPYLAQADKWPKDGRHILAQFDENSIVVYQAYRPEIGHFAAARGYFGGEFKFTRMSWIKTNFLWMMYRSGWGTKAEQEVVLAIWLKRSAFDEILAAAVHSSFVADLYSTETEWEEAKARSPVRLQWDPDRAPSGDRLERRAIQLGLRGEMLRQYATNWILKIEDISEFVQQQRQNWKTDRASLLTPRETIYPIPNPDIAQRLRLSVS